MRPRSRASWWMIMPIVVVVVLVGSVGFVTQHRSSAAPPTGAPGSDTLTANAIVLRVVDGDTVDVRIGKHRERIRLIGINTPETVDPRRPIECYGPEAKEATKHLLPPGTSVRLERDVEPRDDYGRLLAYVHRAADGLFVNVKLAFDGYAVALPIEPNTAHAGDVAAAVRAAEQAGRGLWSACPR